MEYRLLRPDTCFNGTSDYRLFEFSIRLLTLQKLQKVEVSRIKKNEYTFTTPKNCSLFLCKKVDDPRQPLNHDFKNDTCPP